MRWAIGLAGGAVVVLLVLGFAGRDVARVEPDRRAVGERIEGARDGAPAAETGEVQEPPTRTIETRVVDAETRAPIEGACVRAYREAAVPLGYLLPGLPEAVAEATTGSDGRACLDLPDGDHVLFASAPGYATGHGQDEIALRRGVTRTFRVVDERGCPIPTATGLVYRNTTSCAFVTTTPDGRIVVTLAPHEDLLVRAPGYAATRVKSAARFDREVVLRPEFRIEGRVVDETGAPVADARLLLWLPFRPDEVRSSDADGRFEFGGLDRHAGMIDVSHPRFAPRRVDIEPGDENVRVVLFRPENRLAGVIVLPDGSPAEGACVYAGREQAEADARGRFRLDRMAAVPTHIDATYGDLPRLPQESEEWPAYQGYANATPPATDVRIVLEPWHRSFARLRLVDAAGRPAVGWKCWWRGSLYNRFHVDPDGNEMTIAFRSAPADRKLTTIWKERRRFRVFTRTYATPEEAPLETVVVPDAVRATLVVRLPDGAPLPETVAARIHVESNDTWPLKGSARHDRVTLLFNDLPEATDFRVRVSAPGFAPLKRKLPMPCPGATVEVRLRPGAGVRGAALRPDGAPLVEGWVRVWFRGRFRKRTTSLGADGAFRIDDLPAGDAVITLGLRDDELPLAQVERTLEAGEVVDLGTIRLVPVRKVRGKVLDGAGEPLAGVSLRVCDDYGEAVTRHDGSFLLRVPPHAAGVVLARKPGYGTVGVALDRAGEIRMRRGGTIRLTMRRADPPDPRVGSWSVGVRVPGARWYWQPEYDSIEREEDENRWVRDYRDLPPGPLEIYVATTIGERVTRVNVVAGKTVEAELEVP